MTTPEEMKKPLGVAESCSGDAGVSFLPALTASMIADSRRTEQKYARKLDFKCETLRRC